MMRKNQVRLLLTLIVLIVGFMMIGSANMPWYLRWAVALLIQSGFALVFLVFWTNYQFFEAYKGHGAADKTIWKAAQGSFGCSLTFRYRRHFKRLDFSA
jgi:protein-S-isoprenylcysteine O-methyltransferase Ste14